MSYISRVGADFWILFLRILTASSHLEQFSILASRTTLKIVLNSTQSFPKLHFGILSINYFTFKCWISMSTRTCKLHNKTGRYKKKSWKSEFLFQSRTKKAGSGTDEPHSKAETPIAAVMRTEQNRIPSKGNHKRKK